MGKKRGSREGKKYRPRKVLANPLGYVLEGVGLLSERGGGVHAKTIGMYEGSWEKFRGGVGDVSSLGILCCVWNLSRELCVVMGVEVSGFDLEGCRGVILGIVARYRKWGVVQVTGKELEVLEGLLEVHKLQLSSCTVVQVESAVRKVLGVDMGEFDLL